MSEISNIVYDACRYFVYDSELPTSEKDTIIGWVRSRNLDKLASASSHFPGIYESGIRFRTLKQVEAFFKKNACLSNPTVTRDAAVTSFALAEKLCRITNKRISFYYAYPDRLDPDIRLWEGRMERFISTTLGPLSVALDELPSNVRVTSGASASASRRNSRPFEKLSLKPKAPSKCHALLVALGSYWGYKVRPEHANVNRLEFVPKSFKTDRTIACEPEGALPLQLAFDSIIKIRLRKKGTDLSDQTVNQRMAKEGSISGKYATIDLTMASDTLASSTVARFIPYDWYQVLESLRSPCYIDPVSGEIKHYAKFSSMGNGLTFALETLIFCAVCRAVGSRSYSVYGDDIIIEKELYGPAVKLLRHLGFQPNEEKSYAEGPFRESCGGNYFNGEDVTPFYIRHIDSRKATLSHIVNGLVSVASKVPGESLAQFCASLVKDNSLPLVPWNENTMSGVHLCPHDCYNLKVLHGRGPKKFDSWKSLWFKGYTSKTTGFRVSDSRSLFLWFLIRHGGSIHYRQLSYLEKGSIVDLSDKGCTWVPTSHHKYVRKWVQWKIPLGEAPLYLYRFKELLGL